MESIFCPVCGEKQYIAETSDSFVCTQCGSTHLISTEGELRTIRFEAGQVAGESSSLKKWVSWVRALFSNRKPPATDGTEEAAEEVKPERFSNIILIALSSALVISLLFLSIIIIRDVQAKRAAPPPASNLANLPKYEPSLYQTPSRTAIPTWTVTHTTIVTPSSTPISAVVKSLTLNLRAGPGVGHKILGELQLNDVITLLARNDLNNWVMVRTSNGGLGWVSAFLIDHNYDLSKLEVAYEIFTIPVTGATTTAGNTPTTTDTPEATVENEPTLTQTPATTYTPTATYTPTPQKVTRPPEGQWCAQNAVRGICVYEIAYFIETFDDPSGSISIQYAVVDVFIENLSSYGILVDPYNFTLILEDGSFSFFFDDPEGLFEDIDELEFINISPGKSTRGTLRFIIPESTSPETLTYQGYLYEPAISIDFNNTP